MTPADIRLLAEHAERGGAPPAWLQATIAELLERDLEVQELRRHLDRRVLGAIETARRIRLMRDQGVKPRAIAARTGTSIATVYRRLREKSTAV